VFIWTGEFLRDHARVAIAAGELDFAKSLVIANPALTGFRLATDTVSALVAEASGDLDQAARLNAVLVGRWTAYGHPEGAQASLALGRCLVQLGQAGEARSRLIEGRNALSSLGAAPLVDEADNWLAQATALTS
jgi:hypothetical protein